jgi:hypothetical protein
MIINSQYTLKICARKTKKELMMAMINRRFLFLGLISLIIMTLCGEGFALPAEILVEKLAPGDLGNGDWGGHGKVTLEIVSPLDRGGHEQMIMSLRKAEYLIAVRPLAELNDAPPAGIVFRNWRGFALNDSESFSLSISIESMRPVAAMNVRKLLASNMTLEEISAEIGKNEGEAINRGILKIGDSIYKLDDIQMTPIGNKTLLNANVSVLPYGTTQINTTMTIGHINATIEEAGGSEVSQGLLNITDTQYSGSYKILLDAQPRGREMRGRMAGYGTPP